MSRTRGRDTSAELRIRKHLFAKGMRYRVDFLVLTIPRRRADIAFIRPKVAVFVDGCFWHGCPKHGTWPKANSVFWKSKIETNRVRDEDTNKRLREEGWYVIRIWEHEDPAAAAERVIDVVHRRSM